MRVIQAVIQITIDEDNIKQLYPDFQYTFRDVDDFVRAIKESCQTDTEDSLEVLGYSVELIEGAALLPLTYSDN